MRITGYDLFRELPAFYEGEPISVVGEFPAGGEVAGFHAGLPCPVVSRSATRVVLTAPRRPAVGVVALRFGALRLVGPPLAVAIRPAAPSDPAPPTPDGGAPEVRGFTERAQPGGPLVFTGTGFGEQPGTLLVNGVLVWQPLHWTPAEAGFLVPLRGWIAGPNSLTLVRADGARSRTVTVMIGTDEPAPPPEEEADRAAALEILRLTNQERGAVGVGALTEHPLLRTCAERYAFRMWVEGFFAHVDPQGNGPAERLAEVGFRGLGWAENLASGYPTPAAAMNGWNNSPGHRANLVRPGLVFLGAAKKAGLWVWIAGGPERAQALAPFSMIAGSEGPVATPEGQISAAWSVPLWGEGGARSRA